MSEPLQGPKGCFVAAAWMLTLSFFGYIFYVWISTALR